MTTRLQILASLVQDSYYQSYKKQSDFFDAEDFASYCATFFYQVLQEEFDKVRREMINLNIIQPTEEPLLNPDWYAIKEFPVHKKDNKFWINIPSVFSFGKDINFTGVKGIYPADNIGDCCGEFAKIKPDECRTLYLLPKSDKTIYWFPLSNKVYFERVACGLDNVNVAYIPSLDEECGENEVIIPNSYVAEIMTRTYNFMTNAKNGNIIDKTNNQNPNKVLPTEIDTTTAKA